MTPRETHLAMQAAAWRLEQQYRAEIPSLAWYINALERRKILPNLQTLLRQLQPSEASKLPLSERAKEFEELRNRSGLKHGRDSNAR